MTAKPDDTILKRLNEIQQKLSAPKNQKNTFGNYNYRSAEDILEAVKPLLGDAVLVINDEMVNIGERYYVKATVTLRLGVERVSATAYARESESKKGMDESQITGATSSYARKYALNALFAIDDTKDADTMDNTKITKKPKVEPDFIQKQLLEQPCKKCGAKQILSSSGNVVCSEFCWTK